MSDLDRVRDLYSWAIAWRAEIPEGRDDLIMLRERLRDEFDAAVAAHVGEMFAGASSKHCPSEAILFIWGDRIRFKCDECGYDTTLRLDSTYADAQAAESKHQKHAAGGNAPALRADGVLVEERTLALDELARGIGIELLPWQREFLRSWLKAGGVD